MSPVESRQTSRPLVAPFPWFGGKRRVAAEVWARFGDVHNYVEPFAGSLAVLLGRSHASRTETVNDKDRFIANFWRAIQHDPEGVAEHADWPVNECDLHARHTWLRTSGRGRIERLETDPDFFDVKVAGWWVWGLCQWIGGGWCDEGGRAERGRNQKPNLHQGNGIHAPSMGKMPELHGGGKGIHAPGLNGHLKKADVSNSGRGIHAIGRRPSLINRGVQVAGENQSDVLAWFCALRERLRNVRVLCGDWARCVTPCCTVTSWSSCGVFLDPPYSAAAGRDPNCYAVDCLEVAHRVREWAIANGDHPKMRIALCGYEGEHEMPASWECIEWKTQGGFGLLAGKGNEGRGVQNANRERIWFSPGCLRPEEDLVAMMEGKA